MQRTTASKGAPSGSPTPVSAKLPSPCSVARTTSSARSPLP